MKSLALRAQQKGLKLAWHVAPDRPDALVGDPDRLGQVLVNLLGNAIKFTEQGEVSVKVECTRRDGADGAEGKERAELRFTVRDSGIGISAAQQANLFAPFAQADESVTRKFGGTGLGLVICQRLVDLQGGRIELDS